MGKKILDTFWTKGQVIKIIEDENNIYYINKGFLSTIEIDQDDLCLVINAYNIWNGKDCKTEEFSTDKWTITLDELNNIVLKKKAKQKK